MMGLIPYDQAIVKTSLDIEQVYQKLAGVIEPRTYMRFSRDHVYFEGSLEREAFKISRIIHYRNSFLPVILGEIRDELDGTAVILRMRLNWIVITFMLIWILMVLGMVIATLFGVLNNEALPWIMPTLLILVMYTFALIFFHREAKKAKAYLQELLVKDAFTNKF